MIPLPPRLTAEYAVSGLKVALAAFLALLLVGWGVWGELRIHGAQISLPLIGTIGPEGWKPKALRLAREAHERDEAAKMAAFLAEVRKAKAEAAYRALAKETDDAVIQSLETELDRARAYIARNRVRADGLRACAALAASGDRSAQVDGQEGGAPQLDDPGSDVRPDAAEFVAVLPRDIEICTTNTVLAEEWRKWGLALEAQSRAAQEGDE